MTGQVALHGYQREWLRPDLIAGLTAAAVVIPKAMAFATIAGLPVQVGLYTALVPMVVYALLGTSRPLSVSTTTTIAILTGSALGTVAHGAGVDLLVAAATLAVMVGLVLLAAGVLRLGFVANFISEPVLVGFKSGIGFVIVVDQLPKLLGVHIDKTGFFRDIFAILAHLPQTSLVTLAVSAAIVVLIFGMERFVPRVPAPLVAVAAAIAASALLGLPAHGVATVGQVPTGLPFVTWPDLALVHALWPPAVGIALMSFTESIAAARAFAERDEPLPEPNRELFALGVANAAGGLLGAMPAGGGTSQTAVNRLAGARSQAAELVTAAGTSRHSAAACAEHEVDAAGGARSGRHPVLARADPARAVPCDPPGTHDGVPLVRHRVRGCHSARHAAGYRRRGHRLAAVTREPGVQPTALRGRTQARHGRLPTDRSGPSR